jgi:hypothetical protein
MLPKMTAVGKAAGLAAIFPDAKKMKPRLATSPLPSYTGNPT